jgi:acyl carrier protein
MSNIQTQLRKFIQDNFLLGAKPVEFGPNDSFLDLHLIDSTGFLELITYLEEHFGIAVKDEEMLPENLDSLQAIEAYLARKHVA